MNTELQGSIQAAAERAKAIASLATLVQTGTISIDGIAPDKREEVRIYIAGTQMTPQRFHARQNAERRRFFSERGASGFQYYRATQKDHDYIFGTILDTVDAGDKPTVKPMLREYGEQQGYAPEWAERVAVNRHPKRIAKSLKAQQHHPVIQDLKGGHMFTQTHQSALKKATYSGLAELLFSGSQITREKRAMQARMDALEARLAAAEADVARANARLDAKDAGLDWKEKARAIFAAEPCISKREVARRVGMHESTVRKYLSSLH
ncbi:hypothetical protein SB751_09660 [Cupriavidus sp. SIMBA_020]|uniref:hypothetical protein n=1 Tax=Cupriavidus sp. SIMBA_020 TaxID=3085766 RepID=UPI0039782BC5